jgi:hypothetical protein
MSSTAICINLYQCVMYLWAKSRVPTMLKFVIYTLDPIWINGLCPDSLAPSDSLTYGSF